MSVCQVCGSFNEERIRFSNLFKPNPAICNRCLRKLERVKQGCIRCGRKTEKRVCSDCLTWEELDGYPFYNYSLFYYNDFAKEIINQIKFNGDIRLIHAFKDEVNQFFKERFALKNTYLVPVPLHVNRLHERGFNQSLALSQLLPIPIVELFEKINNDKQSKKTKMERIQGENAFILKVSEIKKHACYIIVDDIYTTGATVHSMGRVLKGLGVKNVVSLTLFRS